MKRIHRSGSFLVAAAVLAFSGIASGAEIVQFDISVIRESDSSVIGDGFIRYDQAVVDQLYDDWVAQCESEEGCVGLDLAFPVIDASFEIYGHRFGAEEIVWIEEYTWFGHAELLGLRGIMGHSFDDPYLYFVGSEDSFLDYEVNGNTTHCSGISYRCYSYVVGDGYDDDARFFEWGLPVPVPAPEPGALAMMILGLSALLLVEPKGFTRGRRSSLAKRRRG
jgi:hypothetical protein